MSISLVLPCASLCVGDSHLPGLIAGVRECDPADDLPWLVLADRLDELGDTRGDRVRWWRDRRNALVTDLNWDEASSPIWHTEIGPRIDGLQDKCGWLARLYGIEFGRASLARYPLPKFKGRAGHLETVRRTLAVAECYALNLATDGEMGDASNAAWNVWQTEIAAEIAAWNSARNHLNTARNSVWIAIWNATQSGSNAASNAAENAAWNAAENAAWNAAARNASSNGARNAARNAAHDLLARCEVIVGEAIAL